MKFPEEISVLDRFGVEFGLFNGDCEGYSEVLRAEAAVAVHRAFSGSILVSFYFVVVWGV